MAYIIEVDHLLKRYKKSDKNAVDDISFRVEEGEFFAFLGPNGAGKTTTISILTTTLFKTSGTVKIAGYDLDHEQSNVRQHIGVIFQNPSLDQNLTAEENIRFHSSLYNLYSFKPTFALMPEAYKKRVFQLAEVLGIKDDIFKPIKTFSGGMKRKLEIIRSLMHKPKVLFLDEPTSGLDPLSRNSLWSYLQEVRQKEHTTVFLTTHYLDEAEGADRVCVINKGKIVSLGTPDDLKETLIENYIIIDAKNRDALTNELNALHFTYSTQSDEIKIAVADNASVYETITAIKTPLTVIKTHTPSLEDAYINIINEGHETN